MLVLSLFPGIDLLGRGFELAGFCVVRGPDLLWGGDICRFTPPMGKFEGIIAGSPCQDFSAARRTAPTGHGRAMLAEFVRCVQAARPSWWLLENVPAVPDVVIEGYTVQRLDVKACEFGLAQTRLRHFQFGSRDGRCLLLTRPQPGAKASQPAALASDWQTPWAKFCALQGLPPDFDIPALTITAKREAVGNGVPLPVAYALACAIQNPATGTPCACFCGRVVTGKQIYALPSCRKRMERRRKG